jgi:hypothetical protein
LPLPKSLLRNQVSPQRKKTNKLSKQLLVMKTEPAIRTLKNTTCDKIIKTSIHRRRTHRPKEISRTNKISQTHRIRTNRNIRKGHHCLGLDNKALQSKSKLKGKAIKAIKAHGLIESKHSSQSSSSILNR